MDILKEISLDIEKYSNIKVQHTLAGRPIFKAFGCVVIENKTSSGYAYLAVNPESGMVNVLLRRRTFISSNDESTLRNLLERLRASSAAGYGLCEVDRPYGENLTLDQAQRILDILFNEILPQYEYGVREEQIAIAQEILDALSGNRIMLAEAEVGTGKTLAYIIAAIIVKRGRVNDFYNLGFYPNMQYAHMTQMPIIVATSSIALQKAIIDEYIPQISKILVKEGIIRTPITAVLRKGRGHYLCERKLRSYIQYETNEYTLNILKGLLIKLERNVNIDLSEIRSFTADGKEITLNQYVKRKISVPSSCHYVSARRPTEKPLLHAKVLRTCPHSSECGYLNFRDEAGSRFIDIQVCNHQYFLADIIHRRDGLTPLLPNYQSVIIDEGHKLIDAAQSMYGLEFSNKTTEEVISNIFKLAFTLEESGALIHQLAKKLISENKKLFRQLAENAKQVGTDDNASSANNVFGSKRSSPHNKNYDTKSNDESGRLTAEINSKSVHILLNIGEIASSLVCFMERFEVIDKDLIYKRQIIHKLEKLTLNARFFAMNEELICWFESSNFGIINRIDWDNVDLDKVFESEMKLCAIPKNLDEQLFNDIFKKDIPTILTSGTLSTGRTSSKANGSEADFSYIKQQLGISYAPHYRVVETSKTSPFDYKNHTLLYLSENLPFPNNKDLDYIFALANEIERLLWTSHGHAAILFTSYRAMDMVWEHLAERGLPFPMFRMDKGGSHAIDKFKASKNGVLFATGSMWEGIDIPGDTLSMLIIPKLPFDPPDPISEYEQTLYSSFREYRDKVLIPKMLIKLKQGVGRLIRTVKDTGVIAILDIRASIDGIYYGVVCEALPVVNKTRIIEEIGIFFGYIKEEEYFMFLEEVI